MMPLDSITLARQPDFRLGPLIVRPSLSLLAAGERTCKLEPRVMQVLVVLARRAGTVVARDDILESCWGGVVVGDDALNRCIQRLRAALREMGADSIAIETVPRVGYLLNAPPLVDLAPLPAPEEQGPAAAPVAPSPAPSSAPAPTRLPWKLLAATVALAAAGGVMAAWLLGLGGPGPAPWGVDRTSPLTSMPGRESWPALSPDGGRVVYTARIADPDNADLYLQSVVGGQPVRLTTDGMIEAGASWSPDGASLVWTGITPGQPCRLLTMAVPGGTPREVGRCRTAPFTRAVWNTDASSLIFADQPDARAPSQLYELDLASGTVSPLTRAPLGSWGHSQPVLSPDGLRLAYIDTPAWNVSDIHVLNLADGTGRRVTFDGAQMGGLGWLSDGTLAFTSTRAGDWGVWTIRPGEGEPRRLAPGLSELGRLSVARHADRLVVEAWTFFTNLQALPPPGAVVPGGATAPRAVTFTTAMDYDADAAADGAIAFISTRSGAPEVWMQEPGLESRMLTGFDGPGLHGVRWSPDGRRIAFAAARGGNWELYVLGRDGANLTRLTEREGEDLSPAWSPDGQDIYFSSRRTGHWRIWRMPVEGGSAAEAEPVTGEGPMSVRLSPDGTAMYVMREAERGIWRIPLEGAGPDAAGVRVVEDSAPDDWPSWQVDGSHIWYVQRDGTDARLVRVPLAGGEAEPVADLPDLFQLSGLSILPDGWILTSRLAAQEIDLVKLDISRQR